MANRRMFSKTITSSSSFLMMPSSSQNLYFQLGMNADDDGYCEHFTIMRMIEAKPDDLKILAAKGFVKIFDDKVLVILDWKENNLIRNDRYTPSKYLLIYPINMETNGLPSDNQMEPQDRIGKDRIGKVTIKENVKEKKPNEEEMQKIAEDYQVPLSFVLSKWDDLENWCAAGGKKYKDYLAALRNWVKKDAINIKKEAYGKSKIVDVG